MVLAVSGCASWAPSETASASELAVIDMPAGWSTADAAGAGPRQGSGGTRMTGWQSFDDPLMADLVARALHANTSVASAQAALRQAQALRDLAAAALLPTLGASASAQGGTAGGESTGSRWQLGLAGQWVPDVFGARQDALNAGHATAAASAASLGDVQVQVAANVALNYILLRSLQARWAIARENLATQQETLQITDWRQRAGLISLLEVEQARAATALAQASLPALQTGIDQTAHALAVLLGQPPAALQAELRRAQPSHPASAASAVPTVRQAAGGDFAARIPADTLRHRADVRAAEFQVAAALARVGQAQAQRWPSFAIGGSIGLSAVSLATLTNGASVLSSLLASISLPVFDGGAAQAQVQAQQAALEQARQAYRAAVLGALLSVENALVALRSDRLRLAELGIAAEAANSAAVLARQRYSRGLIDFQIVLETQRSQLSTQDSVVSARAELANDQVRLFTALGGGWMSPPTTTGAQAAATP